MKKWKLEPEDTMLLDMIPFLEALASTRGAVDVRQVVASYDGQDIPAAFRFVLNLIVLNFHKRKVPVLEWLEWEDYHQNLWVQSFLKLCQHLLHVPCDCQATEMYCYWYDDIVGLQSCLLRHDVDTWISDLMRSSLALGAYQIWDNTPAVHRMWLLFRERWKQTQQAKQQQRRRFGSFGGR